jgi:hypothetical protein
MKNFIFATLAFTVLCSSAPIKHFYNYSTNIYIESTDANREEVLKKTEVATKELLSQHFFQNLATEFNDTTLEKITKSGSFIVVNEYSKIISSDEKANYIYIIVEFKKPNEYMGDLREFIKVVLNKLNYELVKRNLIICKKIKLNNYYN